MRYEARPVTVLFAAVYCSAEPFALMSSNGSLISCVGDTTGVALLDGTPAEDPRLEEDGRAEDDLLDGDARRDSVFKNADLRFGGGEGKDEASIGHLGILIPGRLSRSFPLVSRSS